MTYKDGFIYGCVVGFVALFFLNSHTIYPESAIPFVAIADFLTVIIAPILSIAIAVGTALRRNHRAIFSPTGDGSIYGFTTVLETLSILYLLYQVFILHRYLPFPW
jgi:hypothetical protein